MGRLNWGLISQCDEDVVLLFFLSFFSVMLFNSYPPFLVHEFFLYKLPLSVHLNHHIRILQIRSNWTWTWTWTWIWVFSHSFFRGHFHHLYIFMDLSIASKFCTWRTRAGKFYFYFFIFLFLASSSSCSSCSSCSLHSTVNIKIYIKDNNLLYRIPSHRRFSSWPTSLPSKQKSKSINYRCVSLHHHQLIGKPLNPNIIATVTASLIYIPPLPQY